MLQLRLYLLFPSGQSQREHGNAVAYPAFPRKTSRNGAFASASKADIEYASGIPLRQFCQMKGWEAVGSGPCCCLKSSGNLHVSEARVVGEFYESTVEHELANHASPHGELNPLLEDG